MSVLFASAWGHRSCLVSSLVAACLAMLLGFMAPSDAAAQSLQTAPATTEPPAVPSIAAPGVSVAVLPFVTLGSGAEEQYLSDWMAQEVLDRLAQVPGLLVIAHTSSFASRAKPAATAEIAARLGVVHVVEGNVLKSGSAVHVTARLLRALDGASLWSASYDRSMSGLPAVQDEIAGAIVTQFGLRQVASKGRGRPRNPAAFELFARASSELRQTSEASLAAAGRHLEEAERLDAGFARAWSEHAWLEIVRTTLGFEAPDTGYERARQLAERALEANPDLAEAHADLSYIERTHAWNWQAAEQHANRALAIAPNDPHALHMAALLAATLGRWDDAERMLRAALLRDPLNTWTRGNLGNTLYRAGRSAEAESEYRQVLEQAPEFLSARSYIGMTLLAQGKAQEAYEIVQQDRNEKMRLTVLPSVLHAIGHDEEADAMLMSQIATVTASGSYRAAQSYAYRGDRERALQWLERAHGNRDPLLVTMLGEPLLKNIANEPRFAAILRRMNLPDSPVPVTWRQ